MMITSSRNLQWLPTGALGFTLLSAALSVSAQEAAAPAAPAAAAAAATNAPPAAPKEAPKPAWVTSASLGLTLTRGNSKTLLFTGNILTEKKWDKNELRFGADATYGEDHDVENAEAFHGFGQYNRLFTDRIFGYLRADALHDGIADVEYRVTLSPGVGYYFIKNSRTTLSGEVGPGVVFEKQGNQTHDYMTLRVAERLEHKLNDRARLWESVEFLPQVDRFENYIVNSEIGVDTSITKKLSLKVFAVDTYHSEPAPDREKNDLKLVTAIGYKF